MKTCWRACFPLLVSCVLLVSCSASKQERMEQNRFDMELEAIEKVSVLSTDGKEVTLNLPVFLEELGQQDKDLQRVEEPLQNRDLRYTLIVRRRGEAPLVVEVGKEASQIGNVSYSGKGAGGFYRWIRKLTAEAILAAPVQAVEASAGDLDRSLALDGRQSAEIASLLRTAKYHPGEEQKRYPVYPDYRLKLDNGGQMIEVSLLTPTMFAVKWGNETLYYDGSSQLFSRLTEWLPPHSTALNPIAPLFKAMECRLYPGSAAQVKHQVWKVDRSIENQAILHQMIRLLHQGIPSNQPAAAGKELYTVVFVVGGVPHTLKMYDSTFVLDGQRYRHPHIDQTLLQLVGSMQN
ncbi:hypothetical protein G3578_02250 [Brevibacillus sp. SYP-B805]|uniref:hypothetical protein n=1 Tax=Brevibacillus sp. SYP-B805 TaxID=1578199 RepID=UPI0013EB397F|nr:hypothetical protein [Brevibacillus sp. SYP-B805]NGQ93992.1 hypothetical protein [Brevibacillus sp. SYP-B805]